ncbi:MAG: helix-turn-helix transcriptional regulator [Clostridiales bacterium]|nr:helix-turn-helix transcriptional regulator [Clostridiales bacterium]MBQ1571049.1 helix-turn-helix transcriptional regulator [Clostridiales bacterium]
MAKRGENIPIDKEKLESEMRKRGLSARAVSREMGYCRDYISTVKYEGKISPPGMKMLQMLYNITPEDIAPESIAPAPDLRKDNAPPQEVTLILTTETIKRLEDAMYRAVLRALHE